MARTRFAKGSNKAKAGRDVSVAAPAPRQQPPQPAAAATPPVAQPPPRPVAPAVTAASRWDSGNAGDARRIIKKAKEEFGSDKAACWISQAYKRARNTGSSLVYEDWMEDFMEELKKELTLNPKADKWHDVNLMLEVWYAESPDSHFSIQPLHRGLAHLLTENTVSAIDAWSCYDSVVHPLCLGGSIAVMGSGVIEANLDRIRSVLHKSPIESEAWYEMIELVWGKLLDTTPNHLMSFGMRMCAVERNKRESYNDLEDAAVRALDSVGVPECGTVIDRLRALEYAEGGKKYNDAQERFNAAKA